MRVKKHLALIMILAVVFASVFPTKAAYAASDYSYIKVKLASMGLVTSVKFTVNGEYYIKENPYYTLVRGKTYSIKISGVTASIYSAVSRCWGRKHPEYVKFISLIENGRSTNN
jgi:hypothetical protein